MSKDRSYYVAGGRFPAIDRRVPLISVPERFALIRPSGPSALPYVSLTCKDNSLFRLTLNNGHMYQVNPDFTLMLIIESPSATANGVGAPEHVTLNDEELTLLKAAIQTGRFVR